VSALDTAEKVVRIAGFAALGVCWLAAAAGATRGAAAATARAARLARRWRAHTVYLIGAVPYFLACALLWHPLPGAWSVPWRALALATGGILGAAGGGLYLWGRFALGDMYNVASSLGVELYRGQRLVASGPYRFVRHPMYLGLFLSAAGGLLVYRRWALVFVLATLPGAVIKARLEERLLAEELGPEWAAYAARVPGWLPRPRSPDTVRVKKEGGDGIVT
jgi:protein-S-isoprenylcysteine O-methyltransferase Ste14